MGRPLARFLRRELIEPTSAGRIAQLAVKEGQQVTQGALIAALAEE